MQIGAIDQTEDSKTSIFGPQLASYFLRLDIIAAKNYEILKIFFMANFDLPSINVLCYFYTIIFGNLSFRGNIWFSIILQEPQNKHPGTRETRVR